MGKYNVGRKFNLHKELTPHFVNGIIDKYLI